jgi:hypothetical protein
MNPEVNLRKNLSISSLKSNRWICGEGFPGERNFYEDIKGLIISKDAASEKS